MGYKFYKKIQLKSSQMPGKPQFKKKRKKKEYEEELRKRGQERHAKKMQEQEEQLKKEIAKVNIKGNVSTWLKNYECDKRHNDDAKN